jgi:hypothetical protein
MLIRRTIPAMAATLAVFTGALIVTPSWVRPHLTTSPQPVLGGGSLPASRHPGLFRVAVKLPQSCLGPAC